MVMSPRLGSFIFRRRPRRLSPVSPIGAATLQFGITLRRGVTSWGACVNAGPVKLRWGRQSILSDGAEEVQRHAAFYIRTGAVRG
ncbi:hypothetical protein Y027_6222 [Burkholderia pseudomallei TSV5]|nr:hypothetical protein X989_6205 [Burkholderia pseudomallei MSHR4378]KGX64922.1 hypothetical protein Y027_6222 [Burkholderia pseudomallei TSV5]